MVQSQIAKGAIISYIAIFLNIAITFFYTPWMIRQIGMSDYGLFSLTTAFVSYFLLDFGLSGTIARFIAKYRAEGNVEKVQNMLGMTTKVYLCIDTVIFIVLFVCFFFLKNIFTGLTPEELEKLKNLYVIAGVFSILTFVLQPMNGAMMAYEYFVANKLTDIIQRIGSVILIVIVLLLHGGVVELVFVTGLTGFLSSLSKYIIFKKKSKIKLNWRFFSFQEMKSLLSFSVWVFVTSMAQRFRLSIMPTLLGIFANSTQISIFALGMAIEGMVYKLSSALNGLFLPKVTRMIRTENSREKVTELMIRVGRLQLYIIALIVLGFWLVGKPFLNLWVGDKFAMSYYIVILLTITNIISLTQHIADNVVYAENKVRFTATITIITSTFSLLGAILLIPSLGALGCALSFGIAMSTQLVIFNCFYHKKLNIDIIRFFKACHLRILPALIALTVFFFFVKSYLDLSTWLRFSLFVGAYVFSYIIISYLFLFNKEEKGIVRLGRIANRKK